MNTIIKNNARIMFILSSARKNEASKTDYHGNKLVLKMRRGKKALYGK